MEQTRTRRGPLEGPQTIGVDRERAARPGVPKESEPADAHGAPARPVLDQPGGEGRPIRAALDEPTPVFGTAQPPRGASGLLRRAAYRIPEHLARRWLLLLLADRVDVLEDRLGPIAARPVSAAGAQGLAEKVRANPVPALAGAALGLWLAGRVLR